jgi:hypothetical protein
MISGGIHCCSGTSSFSREGQSQGHEGEGKKDEEYYCMFGNRANDVGQGRVMVIAKP